MRAGHRRRLRRARLGGTFPLFAGTLLAGAAIALAQVVIPALIRARGGAGGLTGAFSMSLVSGATIAAFTAIPLEHAFGGWQGALAFWGLPALVAAAVWVPPRAAATTPCARRNRTRC